MPTRGASVSIPAAVQAWRRVAPAATRSTATGGNRAVLPCQPGDMLRPACKPWLAFRRRPSGHIARCEGEQGQTSRRRFRGRRSPPFPGRKRRIDFDPRRHASFDAGVADRAGDYHCDAGTLAVKPRPRPAPCEPVRRRRAHRHRRHSCDPRRTRPEPAAVRPVPRSVPYRTTRWFGRRSRGRASGMRRLTGHRPVQHLGR